MTLHLESYILVLEGSSKAPGLFIDKLTETQRG